MMDRRTYIALAPLLAKRGTELPQAKLDEERVRRIRLEYGPKTARQLASEFGVSKRCVEEVVAGRRWTHVL